jgi:hypothetical protein
MTGAPAMLPPEFALVAAGLILGLELILQAVRDHCL